MKMRAAALAVVILAGGTLLSLRLAGAEEKPAAVNPALSTRDFLSANAGKRVILRIGGGEAVEGTVAKVGDHMVHLSNLVGREYYDALVRIEGIDAVIFRNR